MAETESARADAARARVDAARARADTERALLLAAEDKKVKEETEQRLERTVETLRMERAVRVKAQQRAGQSIEADWTWIGETVRTGLAWFTTCGGGTAAPPPMTPASDEDTTRVERVETQYMK